MSKTNSTLVSRRRDSKSNLDVLAVALQDPDFVPDPPLRFYRDDGAQGIRLSECRKGFGAVRSGTSVYFPRGKWRAPEVSLYYGWPTCSEKLDTIHLFGRPMNYIVWELYWQYNGESTKKTILQPLTVIPNLMLMELRNVARNFWQPVFLSLEDYSLKYQFKPYDISSSDTESGSTSPDIAANASSPVEFTHDSSFQARTATIPAKQLRFNTSPGKKQPSCVIHDHTKLSCAKVDGWRLTWVAMWAHPDVSIRQQDLNLEAPATMSFDMGTVFIFVQSSSSLTTISEHLTQVNPSMGASGIQENPSVQMEDQSQHRVHFPEPLTEWFSPLVTFEPGHSNNTTKAMKSNDYNMLDSLFTPSATFGSTTIDIPNNDAMGGMTDAELMSTLVGPFGPTGMGMETSDKSSSSALVPSSVFSMESFMNAEASGLYGTSSAELDALMQIWYPNL
ncbi:hypothetical protein SISNIDRAFT_471770 [Sistotremastrum niveocremeum HHB9708]|uniref:Uncharacterized protein n=1 Tax=Sistotremastrum niveocremeum HHB9708 TaxID=1314777 RepID=A0A164M877_9AGAM|nr:hypothetical protein SISNIDRAFT_471770 [Sistotremastrum niveocremeum HHB9708]